MSIQVGETSHWSQLSIILGRVDDGGWWKTWEPNCASARAWAETELGIPPKDFITYLDLWHTMQKVQNDVGFDVWRTITKSKALLVRKIISAHGDPATWMAQANNLSAVKLRMAIEKHLGHESWTEFKVAVPTDLLPLIEAALVLALPNALDKPATEIQQEKAKDRNVRFLCLEQIVTEYIQNHTIEA